MKAKKKLVALYISLSITATLNAAPLKCNFTSADISTTPDEHVPTAASPVAPSSITVNKGDVIRAQGFTPDGRPVGKLMTRKFENFEE
ncbi:MAG: hypothetical protein MJY44_03425 [Bacteroidales bacterium]|nr:hypothetical protein [Bacteroidales bacterium]